MNEVINTVNSATKTLISFSNNSIRNTIYTTNSINNPNFISDTNFAIFTNIAHKSIFSSNRNIFKFWIVSVFKCRTKVSLYIVRMYPFASLNVLCSMTNWIAILNDVFPFFNVNKGHFMAPVDIVNCFYTEDFFASSNITKGYNNVIIIIYLNSIVCIHIFLRIYLIMLKPFQLQKQHRCLRYCISGLQQL